MGQATRLFDRLGDPLAWSAGDRCLFVASIYLIFTLWYAALLLYVQAHPDVAPYVDHTFLPVALRLQTFTTFAWTLVIVASLALRRRPRSTALVAVTLALAVWELLYGSCLLGLHTSLFSGLTMVASWAIGLVLFDKRAVTALFVIFMLGLLAVAVGDQVGFLHYAPLFREAPFEAGRLQPSFLVGVGGMTALMMIVIALIVYFVIERWHDRERKLADTSRQLAQANDVISRYVASQLAEQVRAGKHTALERHQRRRLTLFFSDIEQFATTADHIEPEDLSLMLNEYLSEMTIIAERHGATIDKFVGDAIMIFFGAPATTSDRDQAMRSVQMAIEMQECLVTLRKKWLAGGEERPFHVRMGINTGQASVGAFGSHMRLEYTAIGRQVNLAARLQAQCERDRILLSHSTWVLVRDEIPCVAKGEINPKGFREPVKVYEVIQSISTSVVGWRA